MNQANSGTTYSVYLQDRLKFSRLFTLLPGLRLTYFDRTKTAYSEPRFSLTLNVSDRVKLKGAWGRYYQFANEMTREDNMQGNREFWTLADGQTIPVGSSIHLISGISYETEDWLVDVEAYRKTLKGLSEFALRFAPQEGEIAYNDFFFMGTGTATGIELLAQRKFGRLTGWITYSLGKVEYLFPKYGEQPFPASHDVTHELKLVSNYQYNKQWNFASTFIFATGRPYTEPAGIEQLVMPDGRTFDRVVFGAKNSARLPAYVRLRPFSHLRFPHRLHQSQRKRLRLQLAEPEKCLVQGVRGGGRRSARNQRDLPGHHAQHLIYHLPQVITIRRRKPEEIIIAGDPLIGKKI